MRETIVESQVSNARPVHPAFHVEDMIVALVGLDTPADENDCGVIAQPRTIRKVPHV